MPNIGVALTEQESLTDMVWANAERFGDVIGFRRRTADSWLDVTTREFAAGALTVAKGLIATGLRPGDRVALWCGNRYEWPLLVFAIWTAGCVTVPVDHSWPADRLTEVLSGSGARAAAGAAAGAPAWAVSAAG